MRVLVLADIHSNLEALTAVIDDAEARGEFDMIWCLGDTVGYGPNPGPCLQLIRRYRFLGVAGNHDHAAVGKRGTDDFNYAAKAAIVWTSGQLSAEETDFLAALPLVVTTDPFTLVHGSLRDPLNEYLMGQESARATFELSQTQFCLVGHSHHPFICRENQGSPTFHQFSEDEVFPLSNERLIINPGGVGQPRDHDSRPSYAIYDSGSMTIQRHRVTYDIKHTQDKMRKAALPNYLIERLTQGI